MNKQLNTVNEVDIIQEIVALHNQGLGFRKISHELSKKGIKINKDKCNHLFNQNLQASNGEKQPPNDRELSTLRALEAREIERLKIAKEKQEIRFRITTIQIEKATLKFEQRMELFTSSEELLHFAWKVMPKTFPATWSQFVTYCDLRDLDQADAVAKSLGSQQEYEDQLILQDRQRFDVYLNQKILKYLTHLQSQLENVKAQEIEGEIEDAANSEDITLDFSEQAVWQ